jgi:hypothetical protein
MLTVKYASDSDFNFIEDNIDSRCCYFISLSPEQRKTVNQYCSFFIHYGVSMPVKSGHKDAEK